MSTMAERVAAGAAFLDEREPGWDQRINLDRLNIGSSCGCILGQLHGFYAGGLLSLGFVGESWSDVALGFIWDTSPGAPESEITDLTAEWKRVISGRRSAS